MKFLRFLPVLFILLDACVERLELPVLENKTRLVVDGLLTNEFGTHSVRLFTSPTLDTRLTAVTPVVNATVKIVDDSGNEITLAHAGKGVYSIENFEGLTGRRYQLRFMTSDGKAYESTMQMLSPAGEITDIRFALAENVLNPNDLAAPKDAFRIFIDSKNTYGSPGLFRWRWSSIYEALTRPELRKFLVPRSEPPVYLYDPLPCSGYEAINGGTEITQVNVCECCTCWVTEYSENAMVSNNQSALRPEFQNVQVAQVPVTWQKFHAKFYIKVQQLNLSEEVYDFWKNVQSQQEGTGSIFQPNAIQIEGNIKCVSDPDEVVGGVFSVAGSTTRDIFIKRANYYKVLVPDTVINDCRITYPGSTNVEPLFW